MAVPNRFTPAPDRVALALCAGRCVIAAGLLAAPETGTGLVGLDAATARRVSWLTRMAAVRDAALGVGGVVAARRGADPVPWLVGGAAADAVDAVVIGQALRARRLRGALPVAAAAGAAGAAAVGIVTAVRLPR